MLPLFLRTLANGRLAQSHVKLSRPGPAAILPRRWVEALDAESRGLSGSWAVSAAKRTARHFGRT
jgi:hypothetical protein